MSDTRPGEISRIAHSDYEFRVHMIEHAAQMSAWAKAHDEKDNIQFANIYSRLGAVTSSVNDGEKLVAKLNGAKVAILSIGGAIVIAIGWIIAWFHK